MLHVLRRFYLYMCSQGMQFASSTQAKHIGNKPVEGQYAFTWLTNEAEFLKAAKEAIYKESVYVHLFIPSFPKGESSPVLVVDIDDSNDCYYLERYNRLLNIPAPFVNYTPRGGHFFYKNRQKYKNVRLNKVTKLGIRVDIFSRGAVTILGKGYSLECVYQDPLQMRQLTAMPLLLEETSSVVPFVVTGKQVFFDIVLRDIEYFIVHFGLTDKKISNTSKIDLLKYSALVFSHLFPYDFQYNLILLELLNKFGLQVTNTKPHVQSPKTSEVWDFFYITLQQEESIGKRTLATRFPHLTFEKIETLKREVANKSLRKLKEENDSFDSSVMELDEQEISYIYASPSEARESLRRIALP